MSDKYTAGMHTVSGGHRWDAVFADGNLFCLVNDSRDVAWLVRLLNGHGDSRQISEDALLKLASEITAEDLTKFLRDVINRKQGN